MSWFVYSDQTRRKYRKGIWLRVRSLPEDLKSKINAQMSENELVAWVEIDALRPNNQVLLEIWCHQLKHPWTQTNPERFTVFHLLVDENPDWICEGDMGRGCV